MDSQNTHRKGSRPSQASIHQPGPCTMGAVREPTATSSRCVYASVAAPNGELLVERSLTGGNASHLCQRIHFKLDKGADRSGGKRSYSMGHDGYAFRFLWGPGGYTFALLEINFSSDLIWSTLGRMRSRWEVRYGEVRMLPVPVSDAATFEATLDELLNEAQHQARQELASGQHALDMGNEELGAVNTKLGEVKNVMADSIEKVLERSDRIDLLVDRAERLEQNAVHFAKSSTALRRDYRWRSIRCRVLMGAAVFCAFLFVVSSWCGGPSAMVAGCGLRHLSALGGSQPAAVAKDGFEPVD